MVKYGHSRGWFNSRIRSGIFEQVPALGTNKVYLRVSEIEQYVRDHPEEKEERSPKNEPGAAA